MLFTFAFKGACFATTSTSLDVSIAVGSAGPGFVASSNIFPESGGLTVLTA